MYNPSLGPDAVFLDFQIKFDGTLSLCLQDRRSCIWLLAAAKAAPTFCAGCKNIHFLPVLLLPCLAPEVHSCQARGETEPDGKWPQCHLPGNNP